MRRPRAAGVVHRARTPRGRARSAMVPEASLVSVRTLLLANIVQVAYSWSGGGFPNSLGKTPPRGWRSWIAYVHEADQTKMHLAIDSIHKQRTLGPDGKLTSLQDLGYTDVGLDGGWARCDGVNGTYHDEEGQLLTNTTKFPSFAAMNAHAHSAGLTSSW